MLRPEQSTTISVILDASFVSGLCDKEPSKFREAQELLRMRVEAGCTLHAPHLLVMECSYVLCRKLYAGTLTAAEHAAAVANFQSMAQIINFPGGGDAALSDRAELMRSGYGCSRSADSFYIALAESLAAQQISEILTFDIGQQRQATAVAPSVIVTLLGLSASQ